VFDIRHHVQKVEALFDAVLRNGATSATSVTARPTLERMIWGMGADHIRCATMTDHARRANVVSP
jgi:hypothetical protein